MRELGRQTGPFGTLIGVQTDNICEYLLEKGSRWPQGSRLFHEGAEITPLDRDAVSGLQELSGTFHILHPPHAPLVPALISLAISLVVGILLRPDIPEVDDPADAVRGSPTNALAGVRNRPRFGQRVPDIYGQVWHTPDLLAPRLTVWENDTEVEYTLYCWGRGEFGTAELIDGGQRVDGLDGYFVNIYEPGQELNATPAATINGGFTELPSNMVIVPVDGAALESLPPRNWMATTDPRYPEDNYRDFNDASGSITGQMVSQAVSGPQSGLFPRNPTLKGVNQGHISAPFQGGETTSSRYSYNLEGHFKPGARLEIASLENEPGWNTTDPTRQVPDIAGVYTVLQSSEKEVWLDIPPDKEAAWNGMPVAEMTHLRLRLRDRDRIIVHQVRSRNQIILNFEFPQGVYGGGAVGALNLQTIRIRVAHYWESVDTPVVSAERIDYFEIPLATNRRTGYTALLPNPNVQDRDCNVDISITRYDSKYPTASSSGQPEGTQPGDVNRTDIQNMFVNPSLENTWTIGPDVTAIFTRVVNTPSTRNLTERHLQVKGIRKLLFPPNVVPEETRDFHNAMYAVCLDEHIGRLPVEATDHAQWTTVYNELFAYFAANGDAAVHFDYAFDDVNTTLEDMLAAITGRSFSTAYRLGDRIQIRADLPQSSAVLLFNTRNVLPGTMERSVRFGVEFEFDGAEQVWSDDNQYGLKRTFRAPVVPVLYNPFQSPVRGIIEEPIAESHAFRAYNRRRYLNEQVVFEATAEAALLLAGDKVLVADLTRQKTLSGDLIGVNATVLTLDRTITLPTGTGVVWLQDNTTADGPTVLFATYSNPPGADTNQLNLTSPLPQHISVDLENFARTTWTVVDLSEGGYPDPLDADMWVVERVEPSGKMTYRVSCVKYDDRIYEGDVRT